MKTILLALIRFYRKYISPRKPSVCKYYPTCSTYALEAVERFGFFEGRGAFPVADSAVQSPESGRL